jgi:two-component system nitrogen regulation sensor histidine kinase NtrY
LPRAELQPADLATFLEDQREHIDAIRGARAATGEESLIRRVDVRFELPDQPMPALLDVEMMHRLVTNLVTNAAQALRDRTGDDTGDDGVLGTVEVTARLVGSEYVLTFDDDGPGVPPDLRASIFDPYVTTKHDGTGLGLAIVKKVVVDHGGRIEVTDSPMGGARFAIRLPVADSASARAAAERVRSERPAADDG